MLRALELPSCSGCFLNEQRFLGQDCQMMGCSQRCFRRCWVCAGGMGVKSNQMDSAIQAAIKVAYKSKGPVELSGQVQLLGMGVERSPRLCLDAVLASDYFSGVGGNGRDPLFGQLVHFLHAVQVYSVVTLVYFDRDVLFAHLTSIQYQYNITTINSPFKPPLLRHPPQPFLPSPTLSPTWIRHLCPTWVCHSSSAFLQKLRQKFEGLDVREGLQVRSRLWFCLSLAKTVAFGQIEAKQQTSVHELPIQNMQDAIGLFDDSLINIAGWER